MNPLQVMIKLSFSEEAIAALHYERYHHPHPRVQRKMEALYLKSQGLRHRDIARIVQVSEPTLVRDLREYASGGVEQLKQLNFYQPKSDLEQHQAQIETYFREHPPKSLAQAARKIEELTVTHELITVTNEAYIHAQSVCKLFKKSPV